MVLYHVRTKNISAMNSIPNTRDGRNESLWQKNTIITTDESGFDSTKTYDVIIVGAGITGATTALLLQKAGMKCIVADAHNPGFGTTGASTAHINTFADTTYKEVEDAFSEDAAKLFADSIAKSVHLIHDMVKTYQIDCDFEWTKGYLYAQDDDQTKELDSIFSSSLRAGVSVQPTENPPVRVEYQKAIVFDNQAQFHPIKYIEALLSEFKNLGGVCLNNTMISTVETQDGVHIASSRNKSIKAKSVVYATHIPPGVNVLHFRNAPYRSYVIAATLSDGDYPQGLIYDMQEPYHYFRTHVIDGQKYLIAGGHDHKTGHGDPEQSFSDLISFTKQCYAIKEVAYKWSAQYYVPADGLPYIGKLPGSSDGIYTATGYNGNGIILGSVAAMVLSDLIVNGESEYADLFNPARIKPIAGFTEVVKENADVVAKFIGDRFGLEKLDSVSQLDADSGKVIEHEGDKVAVYKDTSGIIHALNPVCTHAQCIVQWNNSEKSWDCPCHGARFATDGTVLTGPARRNLQQIDITLPPTA
jgi:glycine/D-amino acid oxidase-like deaminating enzyme/nitrite reductase/ring-hydroxylating ferredoxin subunit